MLTLARRTVPCGSVEITRRVITRVGLSVTLLGLSVTHVRSQISVTPFYVALACGCKGVLTFIRATAALIWACHAAILNLGFRYGYQLASKLPEAFEGTIGLRFRHESILPDVAAY